MNFNLFSLIFCCVLSPCISKGQRGQTYLRIYKNPNAYQDQGRPDSFENEPEVIRVEGHTVLLRLYPLNHNLESSASYYYVVVFRRNGDFRKSYTTDFEKLDYSTNFNTSIRDGIPYYSILQLKVADGSFKSGYVMDIQVGDGTAYSPYTNPPLILGQEYSFGIAAGQSKFLYPNARYWFKITKSSIIAGQSLDENSQLIQIIIIIFLSILLVITLVILGFLIYINYTGDERLQRLVTFWYKPERASFPVGPHANPRHYLLNAMDDESTAEGFVERGVDIKSHPVPLSELSEYFESMIQKDGFKQEYQCIPRGQTAIWESGKTADNKAKNRYGNLLAYEHNRVKLALDEAEDADGGPLEESSLRTDYINASWIDGYKQPQRYIATQGPMTNTIADFWRMIWQTESRIIVMLTNLEELGRNKCDRYWPQSSSEKYGQFRVTMTDKEMFADYVIRKFSIEKGPSNFREVVQYHFVSWPDHAVPIYSCALISFMKKMRASQAYSVKSNPLVVHCSAGVGRTGTLVLIDTLFEMAEHEKHVDFLKFLCIGRKGRVNMVEKVSQYIFSHQILVESLCHEATDIDCNELQTYMNGLKIGSAAKKSLIEVQYQALNKLTRQFNEEMSSFARANSNMNRSNDIIPPNYARVILDTTQDNGSDYINAVFVNGYKRRDAYIVTEVPLVNVRVAFWKMIVQSGAKTIVLLNELSAEDVYWPTELNIPLEFGTIEVRLVREELTGTLTIRTFQLPDGLTVKQFHLRNWSPGTKLPRDAQQIVDLLERVEKWQVESSLSKLVIQCFNGARASGVYCACSFICDRIKEEHQVDAFLASRTIRTQRPQFIESTDQLLFLYQVAGCYLDNFETYANFK